MRGELVSLLPPFSPNGDTLLGVNISLGGISRLEGTKPMSEYRSSSAPQRPRDSHSVSVNVQLTDLRQ